MRKFRGLKALIHDTVDSVVDLVEEGHESTARNVHRAMDPIPGLSEPMRVVEDIRRLSTRGVLGSIKAVNRLVEYASDAGIDAITSFVDPDDTARPASDAGVRIIRAVPLRSDVMLGSSVIEDAAIALLNGAMGDRLVARDNGLDLGLLLRVREHYVDPSDGPLLDTSIAAAFELAGKPAAARVALFVHGLATSEWSWVLEAESYHGDPSVTFGVLLERDLGLTPIYARYNTGRSIATNGRALAAALDAFVDAYPVPIEELVLIGHSMGGLVSRSALYYGAEADMHWVSKVKRVISLGSPHEGAPLEKAGHLLTSLLDSIDLPATKITARILGGRSAGIQDLRYGTILERDPDAHLPATEAAAPLLPHIAYHFVSATVTRETDNPLGQLIGDLLVRVPSGEAASMCESTFPISRTRFGGILHHQLQNHPDVYEVIRAACEAS